MNFLYLLLPDELVLTFVVVLAIGLIIGIVKPRTVGSILMTIILCLIIGPFIESFFSMLPAWIAIAVLLLIPFLMMRWLFQALLGEEAAGHVIGSFVVSAIRGVFRLVFLPVRLFFRLLGWGMRGLLGV